MANEITVGCALKVVNGNNSFSFAPGTKTYTQAAIGGPTPGYVTIGTSEESNTLSELTTQGWVVMQNLDTANFVQWGFSTGVYGGRMEAGETAGPFRLEPGTTLYLKADTAACKVLIYAIQD